MKRANRRILYLSALLLILLTLAQTTEASADGGLCPVRIDIEGQILDEAGEPVSDETFTIAFKTGNGSWEGASDVRTDSQGCFRIREALYQEVYENAGRPCVQIQAAIQFDSHIQAIDYQPGDPEEASELGDVEQWLAPGRHNQGYHLLFYHLRRGEAGSLETDFAELTIHMGSSENPARIQLERLFEIEEHYIDEQGADLQATDVRQEAGRELIAGNPPAEIEKEGVTYRYAGWRLDQEILLREEPPEVDVKGSHQIWYQYQNPDLAELRIRHLNAVDDESVAEEEAQTFHLVTDPAFESHPAAVPGMAPLRAELDEAVLAEARKGSPVESVTVELEPGTQELTYYYHLDRDGDGVPDFQVTEQFYRQDGAVIEKQEEQIDYYASQEAFVGHPPELLKLRYTGYRIDGDPADIQAGTPAMTISSDVTIQYYYEDQPEGGGKPKPGGGGKEDPPPEKPNPEEPGPEPGEEIPEEPEPTDPELEAPEPKAPNPEEEEPPGSLEIKELPPSPEEPSTPLLSEEEREVLRNVTFVKRGSYQEAQAGQEVSYTFTGFENAFPYPLKDFTIVDQPDKGLDFVSLALPAFQKGAGVSYRVSYTTNLRTERVLVADHPADRPLLAEAPELWSGERITEICVHMEEVPPGFGAGDQIDILFRIWEEPPEEELHNLGVLFYTEQGELVAIQSEDTNPALAVRSVFLPWKGSGAQLADSGTAVGSTKGSGATGGAFRASLFLVILSLGGWTVKRMRKGA